MPDTSKTFVHVWGNTYYNIITYVCNARIVIKLGTRARYTWSIKLTRHFFKLHFTSKMH